MPLASLAGEDIPEFALDPKFAKIMLKMIDEDADYKMKESAK